MKNNIHNPLSLNKNNNFKGQQQRVFKAFYSAPKTMLMVSIETGILRANICRYIAEWEAQNKIAIHHKGTCKISKHIAGYYTTKPELIKSIVEPLKPRNNGNA